MKRVLAILGMAAFVVTLALTAVSFAQQQRSGPEGAGVVQNRTMTRPDLPPPPQGDFVFVASEIGFGGKLVKGAPYSAQAVTETTQTLSDGNRIVQRTTSTLYRDSEGRTRREQTLRSLGNLGDGGEPLQTIFINDPVAGVSYAFDVRRHVAYKNTPFKFERRPLPAGAPAVPGVPGDERRFEYRIEPAAPPPVEGVKVPAAVATMAPAPPPPAVESGQFTVTAAPSGNATYVFQRNGPNLNQVTEQLGKQIIEGVEAEGTRTTATIPAGEIGNERPIEIVNERWYSSELQLVVMSRHSDPRTGETIYKLTNITRSEPAKSLFEVPSDFTVTEGMPAPPPPGSLMPVRRRTGNPE